MTTTRERLVLGAVILLAVVALVAAIAGQRWTAIGCGGIAILQGSVLLRRRWASR